MEPNRNQRGQSMWEYVVVLAVIVSVCAIVGWVLAS